MDRRFTVSTLAAVAMFAVGQGRANAQVLGTFTWQMQPYCNRVTLTLASTPGGLTADGTDDQCGAPRKAGVTGFIAFNPDGTAGLSLSIALPSDRTSVDVLAIVNPSNGQGTWSDGVGNGGTLALGGAASGLPARPSHAKAIDVADNPQAATDPCNPSTTRSELVLCGTSSGYWRNGGYGLPGLQVWRDAQGLVHIRGSISRSVGTVFASGFPFILPPALRPNRTLAFTASTGMNAGVQQGGAVLVVVYGRDLPSLEGIVGLANPSAGQHTVVHFGEIVFSVNP